MSELKTMGSCSMLVVIVATGFGACSSMKPSMSDGGGGIGGGSTAGSSGQGGSSGAGGHPTGVGGASGTAGGTGGTGGDGDGIGGAGGSGGGVGDGGAATCADLAARAAALLVKDCTASEQCAVTTVYNCCTVYTGIRADAKTAYESAQAAHDRVCPDPRGCQCQDHTETNELVPIQQPPLPVNAACDVDKCTAHQR